MSHRRATVASTVGLHARPASLVAKAAAAAKPTSITIARVEDGVAGSPVDAASVLGLMTLNAQHGDEVELAATDESVLDQLAALVERNLDEPVSA